MKVVNVRTDPYDIYIGRKGRRHPHSKWANPFRIGEDGDDGDREKVIALYREYVLNSPHLMKALPELKGKVLGCWCKPKPCHGDVLVELSQAIKVEALIKKATWLHGEAIAEGE